MPRLRLRPRGLIPDISFGREPSNSTGGTLTRVASGFPGARRVGRHERDERHMANDRLVSPPHRTGRADFPHPALGGCSPGCFMSFASGYAWGSGRDRNDREGVHRYMSARIGRGS